METVLPIIDGRVQLKQKDHVVVTMGAFQVVRKVTKCQPCGTTADLVREEM